MKQPIANHGIWIVVTIIAFAFGSFLARSAKSGDESDSAESRGGNRGGAGSAALADRSHPTGDMATNGRGGGHAVSAAGEGPGRAPLNNERAIQSLVRNAIKEANPLTRRQSFDRLLRSLSPENVLMIRAAMAENGASGEQWKLLDYAWGAADPAGAIAHLPEVEERYRDAFLGNILPGWASQDPRGAINYLEGMEAGERRERMTGRVLEGLADHDIATATDYLFRLADGGNTNASRHIDSLAREALRTGGLEGARGWAEKLPDGGLKAAALDRVAHQYVANDAQGAAQWASQFARDEVTWRVIEEVGDEWAERDPSSAVAWLDDLPDGKGRNEGMRSALSEWARKDPVAAGEYLMEMPESATRDAAISGFSARHAWKDPRTAIAWAESISAKGERVRALTRVGQAWAHRDAAAAAKWAKQSGLPPDVQKSITNASRRH